MSCRLPSCLYRDADIACPVHPVMAPLPERTRVGIARLMSKQQFEFDVSVTAGLPSTLIHHLHEMLEEIYQNGGIRDGGLLIRLETQDK